MIKMFRPLQLRFRGTVGGIIPINATGGEIFDYPIPNTKEIYRYHVFTATSNFVVNEVSNKFNDIEYLVVAGAGAGGAADNEQEAGGGGGAGGFRSGGQTLTSPTSFVVQVGAGGTGRGGRGNCVPGNPGVKSYFGFGGFESAGGGAGLPPRSGNPGGIANGGSGGGGTERTGTAGTGNVPATDPRQGYNGTIDFVDGPNWNSFRTYGGGGGGAAGNGVNSSGGPPSSFSMFDSSVKSAYLAAGYTKNIGQGSSPVFSRGGDGGRRTFSGGASGPEFSGYGGQGGRAAGEGAGDPRQQMNPGGNGGSGVVVVRYRIQ